MSSVVSERLREGNLLIIDEWKLEHPKTKELIATLGDLKLGGKTVIVDSLKNTNLMLASHNMHNVKVVNSFGVNVYDLVNHQKLVLTPTTAAELTDILRPRSKVDDENETQEVSKPRPKRPTRESAGAA